MNRGELSTLYVFAGFDTAVVSPKDPSWSNESTTPSPKWSKYSPKPSANRGLRVCRVREGEPGREIKMLRRPVRLQPTRLTRRSKVKVRLIRDASCAAFAARVSNQS